MGWLVPAIIAMLSNTVILALVYLYLYLKERSPSLFLFFISWSVYGLRFVFMLLYIYWSHRWMLIANQAMALVSAHLLLTSVRVWLGKSASTTAWNSATLIGLLWIIGASFSTLLFTAYTIPSFFYVGIIYGAAGVTLIRSRFGSFTGVRILAITLILWGIHKIDYPFLRPVEWFAPWGYLIGAAAAVITAIGMVLIYFDTAKKRLNELLREKEILIREVHHRVKNNLSIIDSLLRYHIDVVDDPSSREVLQKLENKITAFALIHSLLHTSDSVEDIDVVVYVRDLVEHVVTGYDESPETVSFEFEPAVLPLSIDYAKNLGLIVNELVSNALKYSEGDGNTKRIRVTLISSDNGRAVLSVADNGPGIPEGIDVESLKMSGLYLVQMLCQEIDGHMRIESASGTEVRVDFALPAVRSR